MDIESKSEIPAIQIKGVKDGLLVTVGEGDWEDVQKSLLSHISQQSAFFKGAKLTLDVGSTILHVVELSNLRDSLSDQGMNLWGIISKSAVTENTAQMLGLATRLPSLGGEKVQKPKTKETPGEPAILVKKTLRSGMEISYDGHVIIMGDVNPGAEIVASGNVMVWGRLRGGVQAGAEGDESAIVAALDMFPTKIRISQISALLPKDHKKTKPVLARVIDGQIKFEFWDY